ncbi:MAG: nuclear transport factor 2 family protein [Reyranella sp.]|nr:nuclear transport factor 2 family protein [Reyranella sp.]
MIMEEIRAVLSAKVDALLHRSADDLAALLHADFVYVNAAGYKLDKADYIKLGCTSGKMIFRSQKVSDLDVRTFGGCAVATMVLNDEFTMDGREIAATYRSLCVFTNESGRWLWAAGQTMRPQLS